MTRIKTTLFVFLMMVMSGHLYGEDLNAEYVRNYDGDTVTVNLTELRELDQSGSLSVIWSKIGIRVGGVDTPEMRGKCPEEKIKARAAKAFVKDLLTSADQISLRNVKRGKYFRLVADIIIDADTSNEIDLKEALVENGHAVRYNGGRKTAKWCK